MQEKSILATPPLSLKGTIICVALAIAAAVVILIYGNADDLPALRSNPGWFVTIAFVVCAALCYAPGFTFGLVLFIVYCEVPPRDHHETVGSVSQLQLGICFLVMVASILEESVRRRAPRPKKTPVEESAAGEWSNPDDLRTRLETDAAARMAVPTAFD